jgi:hypothetical protein
VGERYSIFKEHGRVKNGSAFFISQFRVNHLLGLILSLKGVVSLEEGYQPGPLSRARPGGVAQLLFTMRNEIEAVFSTNEINPVNGRSLYPIKRPEL